MENITRRDFGKTGALAVLIGYLGTVTMLIGCTSFATILNWVDTGLSAFASVVDLLAGQGVINVTIGSAIDLIIKGVKAALADIATAVQNYNAAPAASQPSLLGKISAAITAAQGQLNAFWNALNIPDAKLSDTISGLLGLIVSTLAGFQSLLPPAPAPTPAPVTFPRTLPITPSSRSIAAFKSSFNKILNGASYSNYRRF